MTIRPASGVCLTPELGYIHHAVAPSIDGIVSIDFVNDIDICIYTQMLTEYII